MRVPLSGLLLLLSITTTGLVRAAEPVPAPTRPPREVHLEHVEGTQNAHTLALLFDQGKASSFGVGYLHSWEYWRTSDAGFARWLGLGVDGRLVTRGFHAVDGALVHAVARASALADTGGFGAEVTLGLGAGRDTKPFVSAAPGVYFGLYYVELGYSYQFPIPGFERPSWLSSHQFSVRFHVPVARYAREERAVPPERR